MQIEHELKTAISTGGKVSQFAAQMRSSLLTGIFPYADVMHAMHCEDFCIGPLDAPEFIPSGASAYQFDLCTITRN